jgi:hypothetical protein
MLKLVISAACLCVAAVQAQASDLSGQQINELLAGATVELDTPVGTKLPVRYGRDGKLLGEAGGLAWYLGAPTDRGRWWVEAGALCHKWSRWFEAETQCLRLRKEGRVIHWRRHDGNAGTATITVAAPKQAPPLLASAQPFRLKEAPPPPVPPAATKAPVKAPDKHAGLSPNAGAEQLPVPVPREAAAQDAPQKEAAAEQATQDDATPPREKPILAAPEKASPPKSQAEPTRGGLRVYKVANVRNDDVLNVRSGPSADFDIVGVLPPGTRGIAITSACRSQWCPVQHHAASGWVNRAYLTPEASAEDIRPGVALRDFREAPRSCLTPAARALLDRIEQEFGPVQAISTCRPGATIRGTWRPSRHASGNAVDFKAGDRTAAIVAWLIANHRRGGTMTYADMDHIHVDIGPCFVSIAGGPRWASWRGGRLSGAR